MQRLTHQQALHLMRLRIIIARAGQNDCLRWWEDESLTANGAYILERIFPGAPAITGRNLALAAATIRHRAALEHLGDVIHLFRISRSNADQLALRALRSRHVASVETSIPDLDSLRHTLLEHIETPPQYEVVGPLTQYSGLRIRLREARSDVVERANALALAYLEGETGKPVFPYLVELD